MVTFRNNNVRRNNFRRNERNFKNNGERTKYGSNFSGNENFKRKVPGRNNHNASKLIEKYNDLAREASSNGDKILSENYFQHADHFTRVLNEQENLRKERFTDNKDTKDASSNNNQSISTKKINETSDDDKDILAESTSIQKNQPEVN
jgi:rubrerythrin